MPKRRIFLICLIFFLNSFAAVLQPKDSIPELYAGAINRGRNEMLIVFHAPKDQEYLNEIYLKALSYGHPSHSFRIRIFNLPDKWQNSATLSFCEKEAMPTTLYQFNIKDYYFKNAENKPKNHRDNLFFVKNSETKTSWTKINIPKSFKVTKNFAISIDFNNSLKQGLMIGLSNPQQPKDVVSLWGSSDFSFYSNLNDREWDKYDMLQTRNILVKAQMGKTPTKELAKKPRRVFTIDYTPPPANCRLLSYYNEPYVKRDDKEFISYFEVQKEKKNFRKKFVPYPLYPLLKFQLADFGITKQQLKNYEVVGVRAFIRRVLSIGKNRDEKPISLIFYDDKFKKLYQENFSFWLVPTFSPRRIDFMLKKPQPLESLVNEKNELHFGIDSKNREKDGMLFFYTEERSAGFFSSMFKSLDRDTLHSFVGNIDKKVIDDIIKDDEWLMKLIIRKKR